MTTETTTKTVKNGEGLFANLPFLKKLDSTVFGLAVAPLVMYFAGLIPKEDLLIPFGVLCWVAAGIVLVNDLGNALVRRSRQGEETLEALKAGKLRILTPGAPIPAPSPVVPASDAPAKE